MSQSTTINAAFTTTTNYLTVTKTGTGVVTPAKGCPPARPRSQLGFFDTVYFMYCEDKDLCRRARHLGFKVVPVPSAKVFHRHSHAESARGRVYEWSR